MNILYIIFSGTSYCRNFLAMFMDYFCCKFQTYEKVLNGPELNSNVFKTIHG